MATFNGSEIPTSLARQLLQNYKYNKKHLLEKDVNDSRQPEDVQFEETQGIWFSISDFATMLKLPEDVVPANHPITGIRVYLAAYEKSAASGGIPKNAAYDDKMTIVFAQTGREYESETDASGHETRSYLDIVETPDAEPGYPENLVAEYNDGQICPPPNSTSLISV